MQTPHDISQLSLTKPTVELHEPEETHGASHNLESLSTICAQVFKLGGKEHVDGIASSQTKICLRILILLFV